MPEPLARLFDPAAWPTFVLVSARLGGLMIAAPLWSMSALPRSIRAAITVVLALVLVPVAPRAALPETAFVLPLPLATELLIGLAIGLTAGVLVQAAVLAGEVISLQMGISLGAALGASPELEAPGVGQFQQLLALFLYVAVGGHLLLLEGLARSLQAIPPGSPVSLPAAGGAVALMLGSLFSCALSVAARVMVTLLLVNLALAALSRAVPQLNAMMASIAAQTR
jgi:flagellar biosynthetic protein FliR